MRHGNLTECPDCGTLVLIAAWAGHRYLEEQRTLHQRVKPQAEADRFEEELAIYLGTPRGRFEAWYAERTRTRSWSTA